MAPVIHKTNQGRRGPAIWAAVLATLLVGCGAAPEANPLIVDGSEPEAVDTQESADTYDAADLGDAGQPMPPLDTGPLDTSQSAPGDMDGNGTVDKADENVYRSNFQAAFGCSTGSDDYDPSLDMNGDSVISWADLQAFLALTGG